MVVVVDTVVVADIIAWEVAIANKMVPAVRTMPMVVIA